MLILASTSPRRHELLLAAGMPHVVRGAPVAEIRAPGEAATAFVRRIAEAKGRAIETAAGDTVLAADTVVSNGDEVFGKPRDDEDAKRMLRALSGRDHFVHTGIFVSRDGRAIRDLASTKVTFAPLSEDEIEEYTRTGEPRDKAGAYAIQGWASRFVTRIDGCYQNVVGLPVSLVYAHLKSI